MFVLASASKARQKLLDQIALRYKVIVSDFDETKVQELNPRIKVKLLAEAKADRALKKLIKENKALKVFKDLFFFIKLFNTLSALALANNLTFIRGSNSRT